MVAGDVVFFYRRQMRSGKTRNPKNPSKLILRRWHGPAILLGHEGSNAVYIAYKGGVQKLAPECVRKATAMERLTAQEWGDLLSTTLAEIRDAAGEEGRSAGPAPVRVAEPG